ncbi:Helix-turn-helix, AraC domain protein [Thiorhodococcus drewsii AZ1]|uniref:Helix-turn-helix, AraC domain protein n=1 Tax=Thiorhodococcus drewsii AZ1 TaxID=765913 RepID=G2E490_9GAMM|nr:AraC family transcriptional regulator [Thiorhodococcus drewsii]EGV29817.1 Helix-turn-helix, AraC domain protein [Thiorhodococcus drewsii AZ1]
MENTATSILDQYRASLLEDALFRSEGPPDGQAGLQRHMLLKVVDGKGYMEHLLFSNGLLAGRGDYRLGRGHSATYRGMETFFGASLMLGGSFDLEVPDLDFHERISGSQTWIRSGHIGSLRYAQPADQHCCGVSIDVPAALLEGWREEAPKALNPGIRAALTHSAPLLRPLPGTHRALRAIGRRMLQVNTSSLCGRLQFESLALDMLAALLRVEDGASADLTPAERRERRLRVALDEARDILDAEWASPPTITELGRRVGLNECYLKAGFRDRFGTTIGAYSRQRRLEQARRLIEREGHGVQEAAFAVGFTNLGWFASNFRSQFGCLPSHLVRSA